MRSLHFIPVVLAALILAGCGDGRGGGSRSASDGTDRPGSSRDGEALRPDTSRAGPAFLAVYREGPLDELRVVRATDGRLVVAGLCAFPDGTRLNVTLVGPVRGSLTPVLAIVGARVEEGRFMSPPLAAAGGPPPPGLQRLRVSAAFRPGLQDSAVLDASAGGRRFLGPGVSTLDDGTVFFYTSLEVPL